MRRGAMIICESVNDGNGDDVGDENVNNDKSFDGNLKSFKLL